jgi:hypothetical protein
MRGRTRIRSTHPIRGRVKTSWKDARVLTGFMDDAQFRSFAADHLDKLSERGQVDLLNRVETTRAECARLSPVPLDSGIFRAATSPYIQGIRDDPIFTELFAERPRDFFWIDPTKVVALQANVTLPLEVPPTDVDELISYFLPHSWEIPVEISRLGPMAFYFLSSCPHLGASAEPIVEVDPSGRRLVVQPPRHANLTQVVQLNGRLYCRNGHNRIVAALRAGVIEIPALVIQGLLPQDIGLAGPNFFNPGYLLPLARPPLIGDLLGPASATIPSREWRYGFALNLMVLPVNHPI